MTRNYDTALLDTNTIGHLLWYAYNGSSMDIETFCLVAKRVYEKVPFIRGVDSVIWIGDSKPYWRKASFQQYKGSRPASESDKQFFLDTWNVVVNPVRFPHFEADDVIAKYIITMADTGLENVLIVSVDTDLLQLIGKNCDWICSKGYDPQLRSVHDGSYEQWMRKKLSGLSSKRIGHLDPADPQSVLEMKVIYGDSSDNVPPGEESRYLMDLRNYPEDWDLSVRHPEWSERIVEGRIMVPTLKPGEKLTQPYIDFMLETGCSLPTRLAYKDAETLSAMNKIYESPILKEKSKG